jgi:drug/metabolite transporter (DMT)-like permease
VLYNHALQSLQAFELNVLLSLTPIWTALLGWLLLNEVLVSQKWVGIFVVIVGILLAQRQTDKKSP